MRCFGGFQSLEAAAKIERERQMLRGQKIAEDAVTLYQTPKYKYVEWHGVVAAVTIMRVLLVNLTCFQEPGV